MFKILIVDDEALVRDMLKHVLLRDRFEVAEAENGMVGLEVFEQFQPHLVILDLKMPVMDGVEFLKKISPASLSGFSVIMLTGHGSDQHAEECFRLGVHAFLRKPVNLTELQGLVRHSVQLIELQRNLKDLNQNLEVKVRQRTQELTDEIERRKKVEVQLRKLTKAVEQSPSMVIITRLNGDIEYINPRFEQITGYTLQELQGKNPRVLKSGETRQESYSKMYQHLAEGHTWRAEFHNRKKNGQMYWASCSISPLRDEDGNMTHYIGVSEDITAQKEAEKQLQEANRQLQDSYLQLAQLNQTFRLFVPQQLLSRIQNSGTHVIEPGHVEEEELTILFSDIRAFTFITEALSSRETFEFLNSYLNVMEPCITRCGGFVDKFIGDGIMALFEGPDSADRAVQASLDMHEALSIYNQQRIEQGQPVVRIGIGLNTGRVMVGALGSRTRLDSTVVGDHVNLAARLESLTKRYRARILITQYTRDAMRRPKDLMRMIDTIMVKGRSNSTVIYEIFECDSSEIIEQKSSTMANLQCGIRYFSERQFDKAVREFFSVLSRFPEDMVTLEYIKRSRHFIKHPPPPDWEGTVEDGLLYTDHTIRRRLPRYEMNSPAKVFFNRAEPSMTALIKDISQIGLKVELHYPMQVGEYMMVEVIFSHAYPNAESVAAPVTVSCKVIWCHARKSPDGNPFWELGLEILMTAMEQEKLFQYAIEELAINQRKSTPQQE